jgi:hypothetical protein
MPRPEYIKKLQEAISETEHCASDHRSSIHVTEFFQGELAWDGDVEVFDLIDHPQAKRCYAWSYDQDGATLATIVLKVPPVDSPQTAVKVAIASKAKNNG